MVRERVDERVALVMPIAAAVLVLFAARGYLDPTSPLGDDASSHITTIGALAEAMRNGWGWWSPHYNGGFPMALYYQPLPHIVSGAVSALLGGREAATGVFKAMMVLMCVAQPFAVFVGMRRAGATPLQSGAAAAASVLVIESLEFGYTSWATLKVGLYTQAWGHVALPLALGELTAMVDRRGSWMGCIAACAFTASTHMFFAIAIVPPIALFTVLWLLLRRRLPEENGPIGELVGAFGRLTVVGAGAAIMLLAWLIPLVQTQAFMGGWPFGRAERVDGFGWQLVIDTLRSMSLLEGANVFALEAPTKPEGHTPTLPVLFLGMSAGLIVAAARLRERPVASLLLVLFASGMLGYAGRAAIGDVIDFYPLHRSVQLFRYAALWQFAGVLLCGLGIGTALDWISERLSRPPEQDHTDASGTPVVSSALRRWLSATTVSLAGLALLAPAVPNALVQLKHGFRTLEDSDHLDLNAYETVIDALQALEIDGGRMWVGPTTEVRGHYHSGLLTHRSGWDAGLSWGVGLHDSLHFYPLSYVRLNEDNTYAWLHLYDFRIIVKRPTKMLFGIRDGHVLFQSPLYDILGLPREHDEAILLREGELILSTPREARHHLRQWLDGNGPRIGTTVRLDIEDAGSREALVGAPEYDGPPLEYPDLPPPSGSTDTTRISPDHYEINATLEEAAWVALKVGYHPFWTFEVDGEPVDTAFLYPGFPGVELEAGEYEIVARFRWPLLSRVLIWFAGLPLLIAGAVDWRRWRRFWRATSKPGRPLDRGSRRGTPAPPAQSSRQRKHQAQQDRELADRQTRSSEESASDAPLRPSRPKSLTP